MEIGRSHTTVSREVARNTGKRGYRYQQAQNKTTARHKDQARHATSQHSGTPVTNIHSPTQRMGDALVALRPSQLRTKPCSVKTTSKGS
ncbi:hypothetical protein [Bathymodiolus platifrons methanotrophic gill symbiont]|uniref:hypothetical protein n=1 Tax=Bathymodiolus platifrons methanotrophic gill symbiont TaxID=113268 RepID=UPI001C8ED394|nr:hypothetical protein [Bathymodiolus platifrons methanotrophic gill symbiont]